LTKEDLNIATDVVLTGGSAGGVAAFYWADFIKSLLPQNVKYYVVPDSGFIIDVTNVKTKTPLTRI